MLRRTFAGDKELGLVDSAQARLLAFYSMTSNETVVVVVVVSCYVSDIVRRSSRNVERTCLRTVGDDFQ